MYLRVLFFVNFSALALVSCKDAGTEQNLSATPKNLLVLTYNICFECMTNNRSGSAGALGAKCTPISSNPRITLCAENIASLLEKTAVTQGGNFDFVGFQEAARWPELRSLAPNSLGRLTPLGFRRGQDDFVTFYDARKFTLRHRIDSGFRATSRPFQILVFDEGLIFVNAHNCQPADGCQSKTFMEDALSTALISQLNAIEINSLRNFRIIVVGDFNDRGTPQLTSFVPFSGAGINTRVSISSPLQTCCSTTIPWQGRGTGDYILDSNPAVSIKIPTDYNPQLPQSDHLPVEGELTPLN